MTETTKTNYKKTLNLPKTDFPMRAGLTQNEPQSLKRWDKMKLYETVLAQRANAERFVFHDGPPYANGLMHTGHLLNKVLKDFVVRTRLMSGKHCAFVPGWDCHGLPIEHMVMTQMHESGKIEKINELSEDNRRMAIRRECAKYAKKFHKLQTAQMQRLLTLADYEHPYLTMTPDYEQAVLEAFADLVEQGLVTRALKPVHWSIANQTALAEAELEYYDKEDVSVYVNFQVQDRDVVAKVFQFQLDQTPSFMIWTTTPWTLAANLAIAVNQKHRYSLVKVNDKLTVIASELVQSVTEAGSAQSVDVLAETGGSNLVGLKYQHPFCDRVSPIVQADYVRLEDGTGLVHTAPGHGEEDYITGLREGFDIYCPVLGDGTYDDTVPDWLRGMSIWDANSKIIEHLRANGHLFHDHTFTHSYPHDWRSKTPVIFRATEQWFISVDQPSKRTDKTLRDLALQATDSEIRFIPQWGQNRMRGMLESRPDWCISRQRSWGLPIPAFQNEEGEVLLTAASVRAIARVVAKKGSDAWFTEPPEVLLGDYDPANDPDAPEWFRTASLKPQTSSLLKTYDILDVWFESGTSWNAVMRQRDLGFPVDLYLEGSDQHRGWFQTSLLPSLGVTGQSPFKTVLTHGFTVDKAGRKMSKSLGNTIDVEDLLKAYGADFCRWWVSSAAFENDIKMDISFFDQAGDSYRKVRNTLRFLLSNLDDFVVSTKDATGMCVDPAKMDPTSIDAYVLAEAAHMQAKVRAAYDEYAFRKAHQLIYDFCNDTLSAFYCAAVKDRLYCDKADSPRRRRTQTVMWDLADLLCRLLAPLLPHTADEGYRSLWKEVDGATERCVHLTDFVEVATPIEPDSAWPQVMEVRSEALKALEDAKAQGIDNPLDAEIVVPDPDGVLKRFEDDLADMLGVSRVKFTDSGEIAVNSLQDEPRCERSWKRDGTVKQRSDGAMLCDRCAEAVGV